MRRDYYVQAMLNGRAVGRYVRAGELVAEIRRLFADGASKVTANLEPAQNEAARPVVSSDAQTDRIVEVSA